VEAPILQNLELIAQGKVRDIYSVDEGHLLIVTTDRMSAFDVVLPNPIPGKGEVLTQLSEFWFNKTEHIAGLTKQNILLLITLLMISILKILFLKINWVTSKTEACW